jgi:hypothetical protein
MLPGIVSFFFFCFENKSKYKKPRWPEVPKQSPSLPAFTQSRDVMKARGGHPEPWPEPEKHNPINSFGPTTSNSVWVELLDHYQHSPYQCTPKQLKAVQNLGCGEHYNYNYNGIGERETR